MDAEARYILHQIRSWRRRKRRCGHDRDWLEAMAREDDARAVGKRGQVEASWAAMRDRWKDEGDR